MQAWIVLIVLVLLLIGLIFTKIRPSFLFFGALAVIYATGMIPRTDMLQNFVEPTLISLVLLLVASMALEKTALASALANRLIGGSVFGSVFRFSFVSGLVSAFVNNTAVVASFMSVARNNGKIAPSRLLIPLSFVSMLGGVVTLVGTSTNLVVDSMARKAGLPGLAFFDFSYVGVPIFLIGIGVLSFAAARWLPDNPISNSNSSDYLIEMQVSEGSPIVGKAVGNSGLRNLQSIFLLEVIRDGHLITPVSPSEVLEENDVLVFSGDVQHVQALYRIPGLVMSHNHQAVLKENLVEVIIAPTSNLVGSTLKDVNFRSLFDAGVVAIRRGSERISGGLGHFELAAGDALVLAVGPDFKIRQNLSRNFYVIGGIEVVERLTHAKSWLVGLSFIGGLALNAFQLISLFDIMVVLVGLYIVTGILSVDEIRRRLPWDLVAIIGAAQGLAYAMTGSGLAHSAAELMNSTFGHYGAYGALAGLFLLTMLMTEFITNNAAAALAFPLAVALAQQYHCDVKPFLLTVAYAASASFLTPFGYQTNLMVYSVGNYKFTDYARTGFLLSITYGLLVVGLVPVFFPLR